MLLQFPSRFRSKNSVVTAFIQNCDELLTNLDNGAFLDNKKAFARMKYSILMIKINERFCIIGLALNWFKSFLTNMN